MTTKHDSFDASGHGFFVRSSHGMRNQPGRVLLWAPYELVAVSNANYLYTRVYREVGVEVDSAWSPSEPDISNYSLVILFPVISPGQQAPPVPSWWAQLASFSGVILVGSSDWSASSFSTTRYLPALPFLGMTITGAGEPLLANSVFPVSEHPLNSGMVLGWWIVGLGGTGWFVNGGTSLLSTRRYLSVNESGPGTYVLSGMFPQMVNGTNGGSGMSAQHHADIKRFWKNIAGV